MKNPFVEKIKDKIKKPYYFVPQCPSCGSWRTGRFMKSKSEYDNNWIKKESLKNGEYVEFLPELPDEYNAFCYDCEALLQADIPLLMLPGSLIKEQKKIRETELEYAAQCNVMKEIKAEKEKKRGFLTNSVCNFIGHI